VELASTIDRVRNGPQGPKIGAFFDYDGTLIDGFSGANFYKDLIRSRKVSPLQLAETAYAGIRGTSTEKDFERFVHAALKAYAGHTEEELATLSRRLFMHEIAGQIYPEVWQLLRAHEAAGHTLVVASSATWFQIAPAAEELGIPNVLATPVEFRNGIATGRISGRTLWAEGKAAAVGEFADERDIDLDSSYAYANGTEDEAFLGMVGTPTALNPDKGLTRIANEKGWPAIRLRPRGSAGPIQLAHTAAAYAGLFGGAALGITANLGRSRQDMVDGMIANGSTFALLAAGVHIHTIGKLHTRTPRPAVFIFNHQSEFDLLVLGHVLGGGFTGLVKKEMATNPLFGPLLRFGGATFIDRQHSEKARSELGPVVDTLKSGVSVIVAPEGTRSLTPRLGEFKKGAFHIAIQAGVPIIPVVIRNAGEIYWRNARAVRQGTIDVAVLEPIDVSDWDPAHLDSNVAEVRQLFAEALLDWPKD
jgi:putative phosphoserine phosphatase / 1-acylglycerol-3-phosphate O-acyltransferase